MTLDQIVKMQSIIDKRAIRCDTLEFLNTKRYSNSKDEWIRFGDMHIDHFLKVVANNGFSISKENLENVIKNILNKNLDNLVMEKNFEYWKYDKKEN